MASVIIYRTLAGLLPHNYDPDKRSLRRAAGEAGIGRAGVGAWMGGVSAEAQGRTRGWGHLGMARGTRQSHDSHGDCVPACHTSEFPNALSSTHLW